jgi:VanZ family protein
VQNPRSRLLLHWIPALIGIGIIVAESTATMSAENTSRWLLPLWIKLFGPISPAHWAVIHHYIRKTGHFVGYGLVSLGFFDSWRVTLEHRWPEHGGCDSGMQPVWRCCARCCWRAGTSGTRAFSPGRTSSARDVALDFCGAVTAQMLLFCIVSLCRQEQPAACSP